MQNNQIRRGNTYEKQLSFRVQPQPCAKGEPLRSPSLIMPVHTFMQKDQI